MSVAPFALDARTIRRPAEVTGVGLHTGEPARIRLLPATAGAGVGFVVDGRRIPADWRTADSPGGCTRLPAVLTPEHLLAAVAGVGITDLDVQLDGPELPHLDGSAALWVEALGELVITGVTRGRQPVRAVEVTAFGGTARWLPCARLEVAVEIDFGPGLRGSFETEVTPDHFAALAPARTFLPHASLDAARAAGRGRGAGPGDVVIWGPRGPLVPLRFPDEPARHKALDALGDLALAGPVRGRLEVVRGSHALHLALLHAWLDPKGNTRTTRG